MKGKPKTKSMVKDKLAQLKKQNGGKLSKEDFLKACQGGDLTEAELKALAKQHGIKLTDKEIAKALGKKLRGVPLTNDEIKELLKDPKN